MRRWKIAVLSLVLVGVSVGCRYKIVGPAVGTPNSLAVVVQDAGGKCTTRTIPQWLPVRQHEDLTWTVFRPRTCNPVTLQFPPNSVQIKPVGNDPDTITGTTIGVYRRYKYSVLHDGKVVEDPEIEIWP
jgi:hypothetical protein